MDLKLIHWWLLKKIDLFDISKKIIKKSLGLSKFRITCVQIHITNICNLNCKYCYAKNHKGPIIKKEKIFSIIKQAKKLGVHEIQFVGGEPFLYPHLKELINYTLRLKLKILIYTNGTFIDRGWIDFLKKYKNIGLAIKFDSKKGYEDHIKKDYSSLIHNNIQMSVNAGIFTHTFITITNKNFKDVDFLIRESFKLNAIPIIERYLPACSDEINQELELNSKQWNEVLNLFHKYNKKYIPKYEVIAELLGFYCSCYNSTISIDTNGEALPCPYAPKELSLGNINNIKLNVLFNKYQSKISEWNKIPKSCSSCNSKSLCKGGCKTYAYLKKKRFDEKDGLCEGVPPNITMCAFNNRV